MIALVRNSAVLQVEKTAPTVWTDPETGVSYSNFAALPVAEMLALGWRKVVDSLPEYDAVYETCTPSDWYHDGAYDVVTRDYTVADRPIEDVRSERLAAVRAECKAGILSVISMEHQMDVALGIDPDLGYTNFIAAMRSESNRCEDLFVAAVALADLKAVVWNFPKYIGGV
jgi:hypothetical protein